MKKPLLFFFTFLLALASAIYLVQQKPIGEARAAGNTYYVATNGNDTNSGTLNSPYRRIQRCLDVIQPGDMCLIRGGTYNEALVLKTTAVESARITIKNYDGETVTVSSGSLKTLRTGGRRDYYTIDGLRFISTGGPEYTLDFEDGIWGGTHNPTAGNNGFILRNCYVEGAVHFYGHNNLVENCELNGLNRWGNGLYDFFESSYDNTYRNNKIHDYTSRGIWSMAGTNNILIEQNEVYNTQAMGIDCDGAGYPVRNCQVINNSVYSITTEGTGIELENCFNCLVEKNFIHDVNGEGIEAINYGNGPDWHTENNIEYRDDDTNTIIRNNIVFNANVAGIICYASPGNKIYGNTIYNTKASKGYYAGIALPGYGGFYCHNWDIRDNILAQNNNYGLWINDPPSGLTGLKLSNNLYYHSSNTKTHVNSRTWKEYTLSEYQSATGKELNSIFVDPKFVDVENHDFHLLDSSPAINSGITLSDLSDDFDGNPRPQGAGYDIGAYEYSEGLVFNLSSGWNEIIWLEVSTYTASSTLADIDNDCGAGTGLVVARKIKDFWEEYVAGFGGRNFKLENGKDYFVKVKNGCSWSP